MRSIIQWELGGEESRAGFHGSRGKWQRSRASTETLTKLFQIRFDLEDLNQDQIFQPYCVRTIYILRILYLM